MTDLYETAARAAGWTIGTFGSRGVQKWWNPSKDDGARYVVDERAGRKICEDYGIKVLPWNTQRRAIALATTICAIWNAWDDGNEAACDDALIMALSQVRILDLAEYIEGSLGEALRYFAIAHLDDVNPADKTIDEMVTALAEELAVQSLRPRSAKDATGE